MSPMDGDSSIVFALHIVGFGIQTLIIYIFLFSLSQIYLHIQYVLALEPASHILIVNPQVPLAIPSDHSFAKVSYTP